MKKKLIVKNILFGFLSWLIPFAVSFLFYKPGGELVVGNFCSSNPDIAYMELLDWILYHRNTSDLIKLAMECGVQRENIVVEKEQEGVNLFIRIRK